MVLMPSHILVWKLSPQHRSLVNTAYNPRLHLADSETHLVGSILKALKRSSQKKKQKQKKNKTKQKHTLMELAGPGT